MRSIHRTLLVGRRWTAVIVMTVPAVLWALANGSPAAAEEPQDKQPAAVEKSERKSVDDALLEDLDNELLEGLGGLEKRPEGMSPEGESPGENPQGEGEDIGMPSAEEDPLGRISQEMRMAERLIPQRDKRAEAERLHRQIAEDLAKLIDEAERRARQQSSSSQRRQQQTARRRSVNQPKSSTGDSGKTSNNPAADSTNRLGRAEQARPDPELFKGLLKDTWGNLPEREREQMLQSSRERFLPQYELLIERYYRRLAEERTK